MSLVFDIETNGLLDTLDKIHSLVIYDTESNITYSCTDNFYFNEENEKLKLWTIKAGIQLLENADEIAGHNIIKFDIPAIKKIFPEFKPKGKLYDTMLVSQIIYPDIGEMDDRNIKKNTYPKKLRGRYSLKAWGYRLKELKGVYAEQDNCWDTWSWDMQQYCEQDVTVTTKLFNLLKAKNIPQQVIDLEQQFAQIIFQQEQRGVAFDRDRAIELNGELLQKKYELEKELGKAFPNEVIEEKFIPKVNNKARGYIKGIPFIKKTLVEFNPSSRQMIANRLIEKYNWTPIELTPTGQPQINEEVLKDLDYPEARLLVDYFLITKTLGLISEGNNAWLKLEKNGVIYGRVNSLGAVTYRCTHNTPNLAQVPSVKSLYGKECRELFIPRKGYKLVGCDASGLELRCLAHYMNDKYYTQEILTGDIHTKNQLAAGLPTRDKAKTFIYGFIYGAGDEKVGSLIGKGKKEGKQIKTKFLTSIPSLDKLIKAVKYKVKTKGYLLGIDKRKLKVREEYKGLNVLLQSAGAIVMKKALCILYDDLQSKGWKLNEDFAFVLNIHDEYQAEIREELVEEYCIMAVEAIRKAGKYFGFKCPLDGEAQVGNNWAETH